MSFGNTRPSTLVLRPRAILVRYEPSEHSSHLQNLVPDGGDVVGGVVVGPLQRQSQQQLQLQLQSQSPTKGVSKDTFRVTPETLRVAPGDQVTYALHPT